MLKQATRAAKGTTRNHEIAAPEAWPLIYPSRASIEPPRRRGREDAGNAGTKQRPGAVVGTKHPGGPPPLVPGGHMAFLLLPDRPSPHPALLLEEAAERIPLPPVGAGPLSHHPLSRSVTIVSACLSAPVLPLPSVAPASAGGCCSCRRRFPPALLALFRPLLLLPSSASSPPSPPLPMPPKPCTNFRVSHSFAGMVTGLANLRNTVDSASETATLPESIPRFDNLDVGGSRRDKWEACMATAGHRSPSPRQRAPQALAAPHPVARTELRPDTNSLCSGRAFSSSFCGGLHVSW